MNEELISESLTPIMGEIDARSIVAGAPVLPVKFRWRGVEYALTEVLERWRETAPCTHGSGERYARRHWFRVVTSTGEEMKIYFERKERSMRQRKQRWWLYSMKKVTVNAR